MDLSEDERRFLEEGRVARLATADERGRPNVIPICFALLENALVTPLDEKPASVDPETYRRVRDVETNPFVAVVVDHYVEDWDELGWVQLRGRAAVIDPGEGGHRTAVEALRNKYEQYRDHLLEERPVIRIRPGHVVSWGRVEVE